MGRVRCGSCCLVDGGDVMTYEQWWWEFIAEHEDWKYADSDALRRAAFNGGQESLRQQYDDCVRQLTEDHARIDRLESEPKGWWHKEVEDLRHQLAAAIAACKVKDEALMLPCDRWNKTQFLIVQKALAIQPDDSALKARLGEPVAYLFQHEDTGLTTAGEPQQLEWGFENKNPRHINCGPLYRPKGLK